MNRGGGSFRGRGGRGGGGNSFRGNRNKSYDRTRTALPTKLLDELKAGGDAADKESRGGRGGGPARFKNFAKSRKVQRKAEREQKKRANDEFHRQNHKRAALQKSGNGNSKSKPTSSNGAGQSSSTLVTKKRPHDDEPLESPKSLKKAKTSGSLSTTSKPLIDAESEAKKMAKFAAKNPELYKRLQKDNLVGGVPLTAEQSRVEEDDDERDMKRYAKLLGLKTKDKNSNKKKLPAAFRRDGFADIFEGLGEFEVAEDAEGAGGDGDAAGEEAEDMFGEDSESDEAGFSEGEEDEEEGSEGDELDIQGDSDPESDELSFGSDDDQGSSDEEDGVFEDAEEDAEEDGLGGDSDEDEQGSDSEDDAESANGDALGESEDETPKAAAQPAPKATGAYVPPHLRAKDPKQSEQYQRLKRHLRGQLNRLTDSNMESIFNVAEEAYRQNPRHDVTEIVTDSLLDFVVDSASLLESFVLTQASFVALIHNILGIDVASNIAESAIRRFLEAYEKQKEVEEDEQRDKVCLNLITLISYLYNIKVLSCVVIYDLIREFISSLRTLDVELLLRVLRVSGYHLRSDDPTSLKDIVLEVQSKAKDREKGPNSFRLDFMIETIIDLKNNKRKLSGTNSGEDLERLRKFVQNMTKKRLAMGSEALRFGLKDLREADKKGKWWITGAAWVGRESTGPADTAGGDSGDSPAAANEALLALARKVNMNTDVRRNIFVVLMSSEDYADAVEKLLKLKLKDKQDREIARVIVLCAAQERVHNPYYELVAARFCNLNHGFKITFQYVLWDEIKTVADADVRRINNVAKLYGHLVAVRALSISVLKAVPFETLTTKQILFLRILFHAVLVHPIPNSLNIDSYLEGIFGSLPPSGDFDALKVAVGVFLAKYLISSDKNDAVVKASEKSDVEAKLKKIRKVLRPQ